MLRMFRGGSAVRLAGGQRGYVIEPHLRHDGTDNPCDDAPLLRTRRWLNTLSRGADGRNH